MSYGCEASSPARTGGQLFLSTHLLALCSQDKNTVLGLTGGAAQSLSSPSSFPDRILELHDSLEKTLMMGKIEGRRRRE